MPPPPPVPASYPKPYHLNGPSAASSPGSSPTASSPNRPNYPSTFNGPSNPAGPSRPSGARSSLSQHTRRPSRAERYETLVENARALYKTASSGTEAPIAEGNVGLGFEDSLRQQDGFTIEEWRDTVGDLLKVVDGMSRQLATHDELAAQLKIAQSNLTLAETHSEYLEEELRRKESRHSASSTIASTVGSTSQVSMVGGVLPHRAHTISSHEGRHESNGASSLFGGFVNNLPGSVSRARKQTPSVSSNASAQSNVPTNSLFAGHYRSSSASPQPGDLTNGDSRSSEERIDRNHLPTDVYALQNQVASLDQALASLRNSNTGLRKAHDQLALKCAELEKTKEDLMGELESLSVELFQEANTMVASERKLRAAAEDEVTRVKGELARLTSDIDELRRGAMMRSGSGTGLSSAAVGARPGLPARAATDEGYDGRATLNPILTDTPAGLSPELNSPQLDSATSKSKWYSFGRPSSAAGKKAPTHRGTACDSENEAQYAIVSPPGALGPPGPAPGMLRAASNNSVVSFPSPQSNYTSANESSPLVGSSEAQLSRRGDEKGPSRGSPMNGSASTFGDGAGSDRLRAPQSRGSSATNYQPHEPNSTDGLNATPFAPIHSTSSLATRAPRPIPLHEPAARELGAGRPVAIYSFEGESTAKSPRTPNEMRWKDAAKEITSPILPSSSPLATNAPTFPDVPVNPLANAPELDEAPKTTMTRVSQIPLSGSASPQHNEVPIESGQAGFRRSPAILKLDTAEGTTSSSTSTATSSASSSVVPSRSSSGDFHSYPLSARSKSNDPRLLASSSSSSPSNHLINPTSTRGSNPNKPVGNTTQRPTFSRSASHGPSSNASTSPHTSFRSDLPTSISNSSLASTSTSNRTVEELDDLMRNIADMQLWVDELNGAGGGTSGTTTGVGEGTKMG
ncbi:BZ3500_MvSof-1268-A1-R1_Chr12-1g03673 [Microbotryum saponariae]|uniref:BZ3500_MvSof-1268-A1-R1_Chr12-1g03673 protein n=1 Tax=Microbotryum saponariae TaxID=289078 RepID=A0A2X0MKN5_9BASI|nr:BZ3500_MvSof-1268-A1-R1_Chr12-1g03673 [Microbotryum saponariae]SDA05266.1 BZ3501_MvSof-1269-A2-R1_Chr12-1g03250 [Microbotryum saponariae]